MNKSSEAESPHQDGTVLFEDRAQRDAELKLAIDLARRLKAGVELGAKQQFVRALEQFDGILRLCSTHAEAWLYRGVALQDSGQFELAYEAYAQAVILTPIFVEPLTRLKTLGKALGRPSEVLTPWQPQPRPSALKKIYHRLRGQTSACDVVDYDGPIRPEADLRVEVAQAPRSAKPITELGRRLLRQGRYVEAERFFRYALMLAPWNGEATACLTLIIEGGGRYEESLEVLDAAIKAGSTDPRLPSVALWNAMRLCDWKDYDKRLAKCLAVMERDSRGTSPLHALYFTSDPAKHQRAAAAYCTGLAINCSKLPGNFRRTADRPLTIGYLSADFRDHPVARLTAELFELHDRRRFKVYGYGVFNDAPSDISKRVRGSFDKFVDLFGSSTMTAASRIKQDGVDILVDLTGNTKHSPAGIVARRPAPVQVNYLGYPGTVGNWEADYIIVDSTIVPRTQEQWYDEALVYMPDCYQVNDRKRRISSTPPTREAVGLPQGAVVYCSFNELRKITPSLFAVWMNILRRVPDSVLWLSAASATARKNLHSAALSHGIDPVRVIFADRVEKNEDHLARYLLCDLFLDTPLYNGHTTASDALWGACPGVTLLGEAYPSRVGASVLKAAGLPEMITQSIREYEELAVSIGLDPTRRAGLRRKLEEARETCTLFDAPLFTKRLEWAFDHMWQKYLEGSAPHAFDVPARI